MFLGLSSTTLFRSYLIYFRWLGLCPVEFNHAEKSHSKTLIVISFLHIVLVSLVAVIVYLYSEHIFYNYDNFGRFNDVFLYAVVLIAYYAIIIESYLKRKTQSKIWHLITQCHQNKHLDEIDQWKLWNSKEYNSYFIGYFALLIFIESYRLPFTVATSQTSNYWLLYMSLLIVSRSRHMQYIFYLNIVKRQLHLLYEELKRIDEYSRYDRTKLERTLQDSYDQFLCHRLYLAREIYSLIYEIASEINDAFGWSHLANLAHAFVQISVDCYWLYWNIYNNFITDMLFFGSGSLTEKAFMIGMVMIIQNLCFADRGTGIIPSIVIVYLVFAYTTGLHAMARKTSFFVHTIQKIDCCARMDYLIESFSLQLLHEPIIFHAQGCFNLDLSILGDACTAITTSMVFFIQFTPRYKSS